MGSSILITGGAGRLGKRLATILKERGHDVTVFDLPNMDFSGLDGIGQIKGDLTDEKAITESLKKVDTVIHLAAIMKPRSEASREVTWKINVHATQTIVDQLAQINPSAHIIFSSSVATYGDTSGRKPPIGIDCPQQAIDIYADSKIASEAVIKKSIIPWTVLRIAGISVPEFLEPPSPWPFQKEQRMEFINRDDVALAAANCVGNASAHGKIFNLGGGPTWQMLGWQHVKAYCDIYDISPDKAKYLDHPGWTDWYDTAESQKVLDYQQTSWDEFCRQLKQAVDEEMG